MNLVWNEKWKNHKKNEIVSFTLNIHHWHFDANRWISCRAVLLPFAVFSATFKWTITTTTTKRKFIRFQAHFRFLVLLFSFFFVCCKKHFGKGLLEHFMTKETKSKSKNKNKNVILEVEKVFDLSKQCKQQTSFVCKKKRK